MVWYKPSKTLQASEQGARFSGVPDQSRRRGARGPRYSDCLRQHTTYWWSRIAACGLRLTHHLLGPEYPIDLLLYANDLESLGCRAKGMQGLGYPFKWAKFCGGFRVEWLGMETD